LTENKFGICKDSKIPKVQTNHQELASLSIHLFSALGHPKFFY
jgi:hypothetical protein